MTISIEKNGHQITSTKEWFEFAPPKGKEKQWKEGRSALEMANFSLSNSFPILITKVLNETKLSPSETGFICEPEANSSFGKGFGKGEPRNHDLLMIGKNTLIGIEAKVSESFDVRIREKRKQVKSEQRINKFLDFVYGDKKPNNVENLYYQLFSAVLGSIKEAERRNISNVIVLVLVFKDPRITNTAELNSIKNNNTAYDDFIKSLYVNMEEPFHFPEAQSINCWVKKVEVEIGVKYSFR